MSTKMANIINSATSAKVSPTFTIGKAFSIGVVKSLEETMLARVNLPFVGVVGNGTLKSSLVKLGLGVGVYAVAKNQSGFVKTAADVLSDAFIIDSAEDAVNVVMGMVFGNKVASTAMAGITGQEENQAYI